MNHLKSHSAPMRAGMTVESIGLRGSTPADWESISGLLAASSLPLAGAAESLADFVVASRGGVIVGCAGVERYGTSGLLRSVAVAESERGRGTGAKLVERCIEGAFASGISTLVLLTTTAAAYFQRFGFETIARDAVPDPVKSSVEFREACPASATVMRLSR